MVFVMFPLVGVTKAKGDSGIGIPGPEGPQGVPGKTGMAGNGRNVMAYCGLTSGLTPTRENILGGTAEMIGGTKLILLLL